MARPKKSKSTKKTVEPKVTVEKTEEQSFFNKIQSDFENKNALLNLILGTLIVIIAGILIFNYFNRSRNLGPSQQAQNQTTQTEDVSKENLPGNYTVKEGDTLFSIAEKYYDSGWSYTEIVKENKLANENSIEVGQVLKLPKLTTPSPSPIMSPSPEASPATVSSELITKPDSGTGGDPSQTQWGPKIASDTYTVQEGDWLSKISGRAYGDIFSYQKIAEANNIPNPDLIEPGTVLKIPR